MIDDFNKWRKDLKDRVAIQSELDRINARPVRSEFEETVEKEVYQSDFFDYNRSWKENVDLYWNKKLS